MTVEIVPMDTLTEKYMWEALISLNCEKIMKDLKLEGDMLGEGTRATGKEEMRSFVGVVCMRSVPHT